MSRNRRLLEAVARRSLEELARGVVPRQIGRHEPEEGKKKSSEAANKNGEKEGEATQGSLFQEVIAKPSSGSSFDLTSQEVQVFERVVWFPDETIQERCEALRIDRGKEWRARQRLALQGLLESVGKIGKWEFFGPTERAGKEWAAAHGMQEKKYKSGRLHETLLKRVEMSIKELMPEAEVRNGGQLEGVQFDRLISRKGEVGSKVPVQVSVSNTAKYEVERARRLGLHPCVCRVVLVGATRKKARALEKRLQEEDVGLNGKVVVFAGEDVMSGKVRWKGIIMGAVKASHEGRACSDVHEVGEGERKA